MKITMNTKMEEVKQKTKETLSYLADNEENKKIELEEDLTSQLLEIKGIIEQERDINLTIDEFLFFLKNAMNYGTFQLESEKIPSFQERLKIFLKEKSPTDLLNLFDTCTNFNQKNIEDIDKQIENSSFMMFYRMITRENGNGMKPNITEESRKIAVRALIK